MTDHSPKRWLRFAVACGALPLLIGVAALFVFLGSEVEPGAMKGWVQAGVWILLGGLVLFCAGLVSLGIYLLKGRQGGIPGNELAQNAIMTFILLLANFPAAVVCLGVAGDSFNRVKIYLVNESTEVIEGLNITWPGGEERVGDLKPRASAEISFVVSGDGEVKFTARHGGDPCEGDLIGYVTTNMAETGKVTFLDACEVRVEMQ